MPRLRLPAVVLRHPAGNGIRRNLNNIQEARAGYWFLRGLFIYIRRGSYDSPDNREADSGLIKNTKSRLRRDGLSSSTRVMIPPRYLLTVAQFVSKCHKAFAITPANTARANRIKKDFTSSPPFRREPKNNIAFFSCLCYTYIKERFHFVRSVMNFGQNKGASHTGGSFVYFSDSGVRLSIVRKDRLSLQSQAVSSFPSRSWFVIAQTVESDQTFSAVSIMSMMV